MKLVLVLVCLFLLPVMGCGNRRGASVQGNVTLDGVALTSGDVTFTPLGEGRIAYGTIDSSGQYHLQTTNEAGVEPGEYTVTVVATGEPPASDQAPPLLTPAKYSDPTTSELKKTVQPGNNEINLELTR